MKAEQLRERLHQYIDKLDENRLDEVLRIIEDEDIAWQYSAEDLELFYKRRSSFLNGEGKSYTMEESLNSIRE